MPGSQPLTHTSLSPVSPKEGRPSEQRIYWSPLAQGPAAKLHLQGLPGPREGKPAPSRASLPPRRCRHGWTRGCNYISDRLAPAVKLMLLKMRASSAGEELRLSPG